MLMKLVKVTTGPILELGGGFFSTPFLHWSCYFDKRKLITMDNETYYFNELKQYENDYHKVYLVDDWDKMDLSGHWDIALIDHHPNLRRKEEIRRLANSVDFIVVHDTEGRWDRKYQYSEIYPLFKYRYDFTDELPNTSVFSNFKDLKWLGGDKK